MENHYNFIGNLIPFTMMNSSSYNLGQFTYYKGIYYSNSIPTTLQDYKNIASFY